MSARPCSRRDAFERIVIAQVRVQHVAQMLIVCVPKPSSTLIGEQFRLSCLYDCTDPASVCDARLAVQVEEPP